MTQATGHTRKDSIGEYWIFPDTWDNIIETMESYIEFKGV